MDTSINPTARRRRLFHNREGMQLVADEAGPAGASLVLFVHGGGQTRHSWGRAVELLAGHGFHAVTLDLRGHGESDWSPEGRYDLPALSNDLVDVVAALNSPRPPALVGASLGGLASLYALGTLEPPAGRALVLVDIVPDYEPDGAHAIGDFMRAHPDGFGSIDEAADAVAAYLPHRPRPRNTAGLARNLRIGADGRYHWHWDPRLLSGSERADPLERRQQLDRAARRLPVPVLLIRGELSRVVSAAAVERFREQVPTMEYVCVEGADHMVAGDANDAFNRPLLDFLRRHR
jgi:pimeloyl-ACP methyl ester carboxylesterase